MKTGVLSLVSPSEMEEEAKALLAALHKDQDLIDILQVCHDRPNDQAQKNCLADYFGDRGWWGLHEIVRWDIDERCVEFYKYSTFYVFQTEEKHPHYLALSIEQVNSLYKLRVRYQWSAKDACPFWKYSSL